MAVLQSDAFVFFGATGDLAYKKIFPALQYLVKRGRLTVPVIGVAKAGWTLGRLEVARPRQPGKTWRRRRSRLRPAVPAAALRRWRLQRPVDVRKAARGPRSGQASGSLSGHSAGPVSGGGRAVGQVGLCHGRPGDHRKALRPRPGVGQGA